MSVTIWKTFHFSAAHFLPHVPDGHKCKRMHGHNFVLRVEVTGNLQPDGMVRDFADISLLVKPLLHMLDHSVLNDFQGLENPTSEMIALWFWDKLSEDLPLSAVEVQESCDCGARVVKI